MPAYVFARIAVHSPGAYEEYKRLVPATIEKYGGRYLARGGRAEVLEVAEGSKSRDSGSEEPGQEKLAEPRVVLLEFPTFEDARRWYESPEYQEIRSVRQRSAATDLVIFAGL